MSDDRRRPDGWKAVAVYRRATRRAVLVLMTLAGACLGWCVASLISYAAEGSGAVPVLALIWAAGATVIAAGLLGASLLIQALCGYIWSLEDQLRSRSALPPVLLTPPVAVLPAWMYRWRSARRANRQGKATRPASRLRRGHNR
jgi:hypothetical protein